MLSNWIKARFSGQQSASVTWSVVSTVADHPTLLQAFAAHYLSLGASEVWLFLDNPSQQGIEQLKQIGGVRLTICDDAHWRRSGRPRPKTLVGRQPMLVHPSDGSQARLMDILS